MYQVAKAGPTTTATRTSTKEATNKRRDRKEKTTIRFEPMLTKTMSTKKTKRQQQRQHIVVARER